MRRLAIPIILVVLAIVVLIAVFLFATGDGGDEQEVVTEGTPGVEEGTPRVEEGTPSTELEGTPAALQEVVVSLQTIPRGHLLTENELTTDFRRVETIGDNVVTEIDDVVGKYARTAIFQGETLTKDAVIADPGLLGMEDFGPSSLIPEGFVAQAIPISRLPSVAYGLAPGDSIDVMLTMTIREIDEEFQTLLQNSAVFVIESVSEGAEEAEVERRLFIVDPFGRFENLPNGELALITPSEDPRPVNVSFILQNAKVIQVGAWTAAQLPQVATPTPTANPELTPTPDVGQVPTPTPAPPDVLLVALSPQQQLILKYGVEVDADIDLALRGPNDTQIYGVENVDINYFLQRFNIQLPIDFAYTGQPLTPQPTPTELPTPAPATPTPPPEGG